MKNTITQLTDDELYGVLLNLDAETLRKLPKKDPELGLRAFEVIFNKVHGSN
jgi:hypothetical protein